MDQIKFIRRKSNPRENANILSFITFFYIRKFLNIANGRDIEEDDLFYVMEKFRSKSLGDKMEIFWRTKAQTKGNVSTGKMLIAYYARIFFILGFIQLVLKTFFVITTPFVLGKFILYFSPEQTEVTNEGACFYGLLVVAINAVESIYEHIYRLIKTELLIQLQTGLCSLVYRKSLKLTPEALAKISVGKIVTLISKDINAFEWILMYGNDLWVESVQVIVILYLFYKRVGAASFVGFFFFFLAIPLQFKISQIVYRKRMKCNKKSDERFQLTQEILSTIRIIKMYTWEKLFENKINSARRSEIKHLRVLLILKDVALYASKFFHKLSFYMLLSSYVWMGNSSSAEMVYYILNCYDRLDKTVVCLIPDAMNQIKEMKASLKRYDTFFSGEEIEYSEMGQVATSFPRIMLKNATVMIMKSDILKGITVEFKQGLNIIFGPVGSGKSTLVRALLRECSLNGGMIELEGSISYASQNSWLFPATVKQNILFGEKFDAEKYKNILNICALQFDVDTFAHGDQTVIGDCGINLSKGQQSRINMARAVYRDCDIYLFDDCLSALDTNVRSHIFTNCFKHYLANKLCILVTHHKNFIHEADNIIFLQDSRAKFCGTPSNIPREIFSEEFDITPLPKNDFKENDDTIEEAQEITQLLSNESSEEKMNIYHEEKKSGRVLWNTYRNYIAFGGYLFFIGIVSLYALVEGTNTYGDKLVSEWVNMDEKIISMTTKNSTNNTEYHNLVATKSFTFNLYSILIMGAAVLFFATVYANFSFTARISVKLHDFMTSSIFGSTMYFFDTNLIGNILNRFSKDLHYIDEELVYSSNNFFSVIVAAIAIISILTSVNIMFLIMSLMFLGICAAVGYYFIPIGRSLRRLNSSTRSPAIGHLNASLEGIATIRATGNQNILRNEFDHQQDLYTSAHHMSAQIQIAFTLVLKMFSYVLVGFIVANFLFIERDLAGNVGLVISKAFSLTGCIEQCINRWFLLESQMTCFERALEYTNLAQEPTTGDLLTEWPSKGKVKFENVQLKYRANNEQVLRNINFEISSGENISIVGRTGAGKSSIIIALFRLYDYEGRILIDGIDTNSVTLKSLRTNINIIPQDPVLFTGTMRSNIDPFETHTEVEIWKAVEAVSLSSTITNLDEIVKDKGANYSIGQRQLICLARALLNKTKIIVLDEATANMDEEMDKCIHLKIKEYFQACTIISISHRLPAVLQSDKVLVMEKGKLIQCGRPLELLRNKNGMFYKMMSKSKLL